MKHESLYMSEYDLAIARFSANCLWNHIQTMCMFDPVAARYRIRAFRDGVSYVIKTPEGMPPLLMVNLVSDVIRQLFHIDRSDWK